MGKFFSVNKVVLGSWSELMLSETFSNLNYPVILQLKFFSIWYLVLQLVEVQMNFIDMWPENLNKQTLKILSVSLNFNWLLVLILNADFNVLFRFL